MDKMKVLMLNGSPHDECVFRALEEVGTVLQKEGIEIEIINVGKENIRGCIDCKFCKENERCVFNDLVNEVALKFKEADGLVIGTPVYYSGMNGTLKSFLDRLFWSSHFEKGMKVGAAVISSRRAGSTNALDEIYKYFGISSMPIVTSSYWNEVHGYKKEDILSDEEGMRTLRNLGTNMAFLLKAIHEYKEKYGKPLLETGKLTNFQK